MVKTAIGAITCGLLLACGCTVNVGEVVVHVVASPDPDESPFNRKAGAATVAIRVDGPDGQIGPQSFSVDDGAGRLPDVPVGDDQVITIEVLGLEGGEVSLGRSGPISISAGENELTLFVGLLGQFSLTPAPLSSPPVDALEDAKMQHARAFHTATALADGTLMLTGGATQNWTPQDVNPPAATLAVELMDENALLFERFDCEEQPRRCLTQARAGHTATRLPSGNVLITGGTARGANPDDLRKTETYSPDRKTFFAGTSLERPRSGHAAALTGESAVLAGGRAAGEPVFVVESLRQGQLEGAANMIERRRQFSLVPLSDGALLAIGGLGQLDVPVASLELTRPPFANWQSEGLPELAVARAYHATVPLGDDVFLVVGGLTRENGQLVATPSIERIDMKSRTVTRFAEGLARGRWAHTATRLRDGRILVAGGYTVSTTGTPSADVELIQLLDNDRIQKTTTRMKQPRAGHTATLLRSGLLLIAGGITSAFDRTLRPARTAEVYVSK